VSPPTIPGDVSETASTTPGARRWGGTGGTDDEPPWVPRLTRRIDELTAEVADLRATRWWDRVERLIVWGGLVVAIAAVAALTAGLAVVWGLP
jgi:hypothetical protein